MQISPNVNVQTDSAKPNLLFHDFKLPLFKFVYYYDNCYSMILGFLFYKLIIVTSSSHNPQIAGYIFLADIHTCTERQQMGFLDKLKGKQLSYTIHL